MANSVDPDQTAPIRLWSGSTLFAQPVSSKYLELLCGYNTVDASSVWAQSIRKKQSKNFNNCYHGYTSFLLKFDFINTKIN